MVLAALLNSYVNQNNSDLNHKYSVSPLYSNSRIFRAKILKKLYFGHKDN